MEGEVGRTEENALMKYGKQEYEIRWSFKNCCRLVVNNFYKFDSLHVWGNTRNTKCIFYPNNLSHHHIITS